MTTTDPSETVTYLYETTVDLHRRGSVEHQQRALCVQYEDAAAKVTVTYMGETGLGTQLNIDIPASEVPVMGRALYAAAGLLNPVAQMERLREDNAWLDRHYRQAQEADEAMHEKLSTALGLNEGLSWDALVDKVRRMRDENARLCAELGGMPTDDERASRGGV